MFQTGGEKGHYTWDSHLLVAPPRVVGQKSDCSMLKENGREGGVSPGSNYSNKNFGSEGREGLE